MSQDLLSFLDEPGSKPSAESLNASRNVSLTQTTTGSPEFNSLDSHDAADIWKTKETLQNPSPSGHQVVNDADENDDFGDFEDASTVAPPAPAPVSASIILQPSPSPPKPKPPTKPLRSKASFPPKAAKPSKSVGPPQPPPPKKDTTNSHPFAGRMDLLFEADGDDYDAGADELGDLANNPEAAMEYSKRIIAEQEESAKGKGVAVLAEQRGGFVDLEEVKGREVGDAVGKGGSGSGSGRAKDPNVLFDADDVSDHESGGEDDFGEFETWNEPVANASAQSRSRTEPLSSGMDLLGLDYAPQQQKLQISAQTRPASQTIRARQSNGKPKTPVTSSSSAIQQQDDDFWDDFETTSTAPKQQQHTPPSQPQQDEDTSWPDFEPSPPTQPNSQPTRTPKPPLSNSSTPHPLPPTNIPPPSNLLTLFPPIFASADSALFSTTAKLDLKSRTALLAHPATHQFLRGHLAACKVLARIIAGRKLRWKRDQRLSQSMRIGPSAAGGGKGGMKLTGLDKSEVAKEDREVLDTIRLYRAQLGKLRSAVTAASSAPGLPKLPPVVDISETMAVKALSQGEGGVTATHACALCGLKREERVRGVDDVGLGVEDSFGEWWVKEVGMHTGCWEFWGSYEGKLKSR